MLEPHVLMDFETNVMELLDTYKGEISTAEYLEWVSRELHMKIENAIEIMLTEGRGYNGINPEDYRKQFLGKPLYIVCCKDCKHYKFYGLSEETVSECMMGHFDNPAENWYCASGERKS